MNTSFRAMTREDLPHVINIRNYEETRMYLENNSEFSIEQAQDWFDKTNPRWFVIELGDEIIGYIRTSDRTTDSVYVGMDLHPIYRGQGIGFKTYVAFFHYLNYIEKLKTLKLKVFKFNNVALSLYKKLGFNETDSTLVDGEEYITMELHLNDFKY